MNPNLANIMPEIPEGYRFRLVRERNMFSNSGYIEYLFLEKKVWRFWRVVAREHSEVWGLERAGKMIKDKYFGPDENSKYLGTTL